MNPSVGHEKILEMQRVSAYYGQVQALREVSLNIKIGEVVALLGANGAGKTTTLRVISGLEKIDSGVIMIGEENAAGLSPAERNVAFVYQTFSLYPQLTVRQNLEFPLKSPL